MGTIAGVATYAFFLYYDLAIFGWNLGLFFSPLVAGYVETYIANKLIGEGTGAISAFILFLVTVAYGFIISNTTLGWNLITFASIVVIFQAAIPTAINYLLIASIVELFSKISVYVKKIKDQINAFRVAKLGKDPEPIEDYEFDEIESNRKINSQNFYYLSSTNMPAETYENLGYFFTTIPLERDGRMATPDPEIREKKHLKVLKTGKDECLIRLAEEIKKQGGNGVLDLEINYFLNGLGGSYYQIVAQGMGIRIKERHQAS